ncbi:MAG: 30S ribosomal protein S21 [Gemmataceae bacterium]
MDFSPQGEFATTRLWEIAVRVEAGTFGLSSPPLPELTIQRNLLGECMPLRMRVHEREPIGLALRRFKKLLERSGIQKELRKRKYYEKPCEARRRAELRKQSAIRKAKNGGIRKP